MNGIIGCVETHVNLNNYPPMAKRWERSERWSERGKYSHYEDNIISLRCGFEFIMVDSVLFNLNWGQCVSEVKVHSWVADSLVLSGGSEGSCDGSMGCSSRKISISCFFPEPNINYYLRIKNAGGYVLIAVYLFIYLYACYSHNSKSIKPNRMKFGGMVGYYLGTIWLDFGIDRVKDQGQGHEKVNVFFLP